MRSNRFPPSTALLLLQLCLALLLVLQPVLIRASPDSAPGDPSDYESALTEFNAQNYTAANAHLKTALRTNPDHLPSRVLLGKTQLLLGWAPEAEKELRLALAGGAAQDSILISLGNALLLQRKYQEILQTITTDGASSAGRYQVLTLRGRAQRELGELAAAHQSFDEAIAHNNKRIEALLGKSRTYAAAGDYTNAQAWLDTALQAAPEAAELNFEMANIRRLQGDNNAAMALYSKALSAAPEHLPARLGRASMNLMAGELEQARVDAEYVHRRNPQDPEASLLYARALEHLEQPEEAKAVLHTAAEYLAQIDDQERLQQPALLRVAALISLQQGNFDKANDYLDRYVKRVPNEVRVQVISARVKLQLGDTEGALRILEPASSNAVADAEILGLLGEAYLDMRRFDEAQEVLEIAAQVQPDQPRIQTRLALGELGNGPGDEAWAYLGTAHAEASGSTVSAGIVMATILVRNHNYDQALTVAQGLQQREAHNPVINNLLGIIYLGRAELEQARLAFKQALAEHPDFIPSEYNLGLMEMEAGNLEVARKHFNHIIKLKPEQNNALLALAEIDIAQGNFDAAIATLKTASAANADNNAQIRLIEILLQTGDLSTAQRAGAELPARYREDARALELRALVELAAGNREKAIGLFRSAFHYADTDGALQIRVADQLTAINEDTSAKTALVLALSTDHKMAAHDRLVQLHLRNNDLKTARIQAKHAHREGSDSPLGDVIDARILQYEGRFEEAITLYQKALAEAEIRDALLTLFRLYDSLGRHEEGFQLLQTWTGKYPEDTIALRILALSYLKANRRDDARVLLESLVQSRPDDSLVLASLAQMYAQSGNPKARALAERAVELAPDWPIALDTYGWILVQDNENETGLRYLREAIAKDNNPLIRYHLAAALHALGRQREASAQLERILQLEPRPQWIDSAQELYDTINAPK